MAASRAAFVLLLMGALLLAGCYQQSGDTFEPVNSRNAEPLFTPTSQTERVIIVPGSSDETPTSPDETLIPDEETPEASSTPAVLSAPDGTPTVIIIVPPGAGTSSPLNTLAPSPTRTPTQERLTDAQGTPLAIITPEAPAQFEFPTPTISPTIDPNLPPIPGLPPTPTALDSASERACTYTIQSGNTLFGIALRFEVSLADLLELNGLTDRSIIQPGQVLRLPGCDDAGLASIAPTPTAPIPTEAAPTGSTFHIVQAGETLSTIAQRYGVSMNAIIEANELANPNRLDINQRLIIPVAPR